MCDLKIKSVFYAKDRLDELDEIPKTPNDNIDYWKASKLLCEKDGGRLATMDELAQLASYIYGVNIPPYANVDKLKVKQMHEELQKFEMPFYVWSSSELSSYYAYYWYFFYSSYTGWSYSSRTNSDQLAVCLGE